jgi:hypothetical protein
MPRVAMQQRTCIASAARGWKRQGNVPDPLFTPPPVRAVGLGRELHESFASTRELAASLLRIESNTALMFFNGQDSDDSSYSVPEGSSLGKLMRQS